MSSHRVITTAIRIWIFIPWKVVRRHRKIHSSGLYSARAGSPGLAEPAPSGTGPNRSSCNRSSGEKGHRPYVDPSSAISRSDVAEIDSEVSAIREGRFDVAVRPECDQVTQARYHRIIGIDSATFRMKKPVHNVTWFQAETYCETVGGTLPTEPQWEYARAWAVTAVTYGMKNARPESAPCSGRIRKTSGKSPMYGPHEVGSLKPNSWGLFDMAGMSPNGLWILIPRFRSMWKRRIERLRARL